MTDEIISILNRIGRIEQKIERLKSRRPTEKRLERIAKQEAKLAIKEQDLAYEVEKAVELDDLAEARAEAKAKAKEAGEPDVEPQVEAKDIELPMDQFEFSYSKVTDDQGNDRLIMVEVEVVDSPFDDTFTGGEPLMVRSSATTVQVDPVTGKSCGGKTTTNSGGLTHVWGDTRRDTITFGDSLYLDWENYREVTVTLAKNDEEWRDGGPLNFPVASDTFLVADVFPGL